jgi:hypothetical protein
VFRAAGQAADLAHSSSRPPRTGTVHRPLVFLCLAQEPCLDGGRSRCLGKRPEMGRLPPMIIGNIPWQRPLKFFINHRPDLVAVCFDSATNDASGRSHIYRNAVPLERGDNFILIIPRFAPRPDYAVPAKAGIYASRNLRPSACRSGYPLRSPIRRGAVEGWIPAYRRERGRASRWGKIRCRQARHRQAVRCDIRYS